MMFPWEEPTLPRMLVEINPGQEVTIALSQDGKILIVRKPSGTQLVAIDHEPGDNISIEIEHSYRHLWQNPMQTVANPRWPGDPK